MEPLWFGPAAAKRFGWYHAGEGPPSGAGVVICPPLGYEDVCGHRSLRALARVLAVAGLPVLRPEYHGTGDSTGDDAQPDRVRAWIDSIDLAADALRAMAGVTAIHLVGVRLGATLAAVAAAHRSDVRSLVLWAPLTSGRAYLREMRMLRRAREKEHQAPPDGVPLGRGEHDEEASGFLLSEATLAALGAIDLRSLPRAPAPEALLIAREDLPPDERLANHFTSLGMAIARRQPVGYVPMMRDPHHSHGPTAAFGEIVGWLSERKGSAGLVSGALAPGSASIDVPPERLWPGGAREKAVWFGETRGLFGILTRPVANSEAPERRAVVMLNAGGVRRIGPDRLYVRMARAWAGHGIASFRVDLTGLGDSAGGDDASVYMYSSEGVTAAREALAYLRQQGFERFLLLGLCSGAYVSFHAAIEDPSVERAVMLNPQTFFWKVGDSLDVGDRRRRNFDDTQFYFRALLRSESWQKALRGEAGLKTATRVLLDRARILTQEKLRRVFLRLRGKEDEVLAAFRRMVAKDVEALLVYSQGDQGLDYLQAHLGKGARELGPQHRVALEVIDGPDHTFTPLWSQERLMGIVTAWVVSRLGDGRHSGAGPGPKEKGGLTAA